MKKLLSLLILLMFAAQMSWAVDTYCQDGQGLGVQVCTDRAEQVQSASDKNGESMAIDLDCSNCGLNGAAIVATRLHFPLPSSPMVLRAVHATIHLSSLAERPERPQWRLSRA